MSPAPGRGHHGLPSPLPSPRASNKGHRAGKGLRGCARVTAGFFIKAQRKAAAVAAPVSPKAARGEGEGDGGERRGGSDEGQEGDRAAAAAAPREGNPCG